MGTKFSDYLAKREVDRDADEAELAEIFDAHFSSVAEMVSIGRQVALARTERGWTQAELAHRAGVPQPEISKIESDRANPTKATLEKIGEPLGLRPRFVPFITKRA